MACRCLRLSADFSVHAHSRKQHGIHFGTWQGIILNAIILATALMPSQLCMTAGLLQNRDIGSTAANCCH